MRVHELSRVQGTGLLLALAQVTKCGAPYEIFKVFSVVDGGSKASWVEVAWGLKCVI